MATDMKNENANHLEDIETSTSDEQAADVPEYDAKETQRILRKVDYRLLPMLTLLYVLSFIDRSNIGNAKVAGMNSDLGLTGPQYNIALTVFFFPYALFEVPSNVVLKLVKPSIWIGCMMIAWGTVMTLMGIVQSYGGLVGARVALGFAETGFFPASTFLLTTWYRRFELQTRMAVFFSAASLAGAFSGLLAYAIQNMDGICGLRGWRWIFILEGIATVGVGAGCFALLPDGPAEAAAFLSVRERRFLVRRLRMDAGTRTGRVETADAFSWPAVRAALGEWKIWCAVVVYWGNSISLYGFTYSAPSVILNLGYTAAAAQLLTIPIYILGAIATIIVSYWADRRQKRWPFIAGPFCVAAGGFLGLLCIPHPRLPGLTYALLFCVPAGVYPPLIGVLAWVGNNLAPSWKRAVGMALLISVGNLGGAVGCNVYLEAEAPHYWLGFGFGLGISLAAVAATLVLKVAYERLNAEKEAVGSEEEVRARWGEEELRRMGDRSPLFRYAV
ncbi:retrograde regulation protein 2 [Diplodia corticola]|uniref:Retrograde regulation protein 2 n=1 Tax=Diplodia corticola TaxID=236234 RepID=A0A1J9RDF6_9PEZI|nr:retrograde regulation protein 2 [Diplodia corticola]OJD38568.1 retrograde regulation protein 2 [Diplodia corticola]